MFLKTIPERSFYRQEILRSFRALEYFKVLKINIRALVIKLTNICIRTVQQEELANDNYSNIRIISYRNTSLTVPVNFRVTHMSRHHLATVPESFERHRLQVKALARGIGCSVTRKYNEKLPNVYQMLPKK